MKLNMKLTEVGKRKTDTEIKSSGEEFRGKKYIRKEI